MLRVPVNFLYPPLIPEAYQKSPLTGFLPNINNEPKAHRTGKSTLRKTTQETKKDILQLLIFLQKYKNLSF